MARPTNKVRVMVAAASGCCASELRAVATARPSPSAGPMLPMAMVRPAVTIEATAMSVMLSIVFLLLSLLMFHVLHRRGWFASARGRRDINRCQDAENVGLHHAGKQTERGHDDRKNERRDGQQNAMIIAPLIMLPNRRTARASVRESSLMMLNGSIMTVGSV